MEDARPLRILALSSLFPTAAAPNHGIFVARSLEALAQQPGVEVEVIAPIARAPWPLSLHPKLRPPAATAGEELRGSIRVHRPSFLSIPRYGARWNAAAMARAALPIAQEIARTRRVDVIDAHFFHPDAAAASRLSAALGVPFAVTARGSDIAYWGHRPAIRDQMQAAARKAGAVLPVSDDLAATMRAMGFQKEHMAMRRTGLDVTRFHATGRVEARRRLGVREFPTLLTVGALIPLKGHRLLLEALPQLLQDYPDLHWYVAGSGPEGEALRDRAIALGLTGSVTFLGQVQHDDLPDWFRASDLMVLPTEREGLANVWVEAMGCGTRVVTTDIPSAHEAIRDSQEGALTRREPDAIASAIRSLLAQPHDPQALSARTHARFDWAIHGAEMAEQLRAAARRGFSGSAR